MGAGEDDTVEVDDDKADEDDEDELVWSEEGRVL